jgi:putative membrane protein
MHRDWMSWGPGGGFGGMWIGPIIWILLLTLGIWLATALVRRNGCVDRSGGGSSKSPREILDERFARGAIDDEEYRRRRSAIES